eukprot:scaffold62837_cov60-Phaeocystis_antarctica.AAC.1
MEAAAREVAEAAAAVAAAAAAVAATGRGHSSVGRLARSYCNKGKAYRTATLFILELARASHTHTYIKIIRLYAHLP